jgi:hypothetical protein
MIILSRATWRKVRRPGGAPIIGGLNLVRCFTLDLLWYLTTLRYYPGRFKNVATLVGLTARVPDLAGGALFDDFTGDGRPDVLTTTFDVDHGASLYVNRGDGTFEDRSKAAGLDDQVYSLNATR